MKHLKTSLTDFRQMFTRLITVREIAEPLASFDHSKHTGEVCEFMDKHEYDVVGVRMHGVVHGYAIRPEIKGDTLDNCLHTFERGDVLSDSEPLTSVFDSLRERRYVFVRILGHVGGIVTRGDLQKAPVRMWLFGLISLLEMQMQRIIQEHYPDDTWRTLLTEERNHYAKKLFEERRRRGEQNVLLDCLQLGDKGRILLKSADFFKSVKFTSKQSFEDFIHETEKLRNALAHSNHIAIAHWAAMIDLVKVLENTLMATEGIRGRRKNPGG